MSRLNNPSKPFLVRIACIFLVLVSGHVSAARAAEQPQTRDFLVASGAMGLALGLEVVAKDRFLPDEPRFTVPNKLDAALRKRLYWGAENRGSAEAWSDRLIYGISMSSLLWGPIVSKEQPQAALINMEVFSANSILTNLFKIRAGRERPYHYYGTRMTMGKKDFASFYSGHSSVAFSQAVTNAMILSLDYPHQKTLIWSTLLSSAGLTAYLRVAGDMHYFSDIFVGALAGSFVAWSITQLELNRFDRMDQIHQNDVQRYLRSGRDFTITLKIPLG